ncbi:transaldolase [Anaerolinea thermolimosa]|uniref:bifunctional transaldolase/phosoglucose isomerase n=1 Tax=Anaerolinea thermolimosa TaxID=229919 RepID=UPI000781B6F8|nr:bifunctional transaldolase/phosoglucose isomerase [Anaerolinea thermolimosa]GAP06590.1 transaldolase [Anaerolinea thermolimosa]
MKPFDDLLQIGQSIWYDNIQRSLLRNGELANLIAAGEIRGITSNPAIFNNAIAKSSDYDTALTPMAWAGWTADRIFHQLSLEDIREAADLFRPLYEETQGRDGYVSLEVNPFLAHDTQDTLREARQLWREVNRPNLMIKIPATKEGIPAIREAIAEGINVNVTLIFSLKRYAEVMDAYLTGLERRVAAGLPVHSIASVASFFVSRVDTKVDGLLAELTQSDGTRAELAQQLVGKAAIANARLAYSQFMEVFSGKRFQALQAQGAKVQRPLWASTSTKNPRYRDVMYVEELIGPDTVNTVPPQTLSAFRDHGCVRLSLTENADESRKVLNDLESLGISMEKVTQELEQEGVKAFADAFASLLKAIDEKRSAAQACLGVLRSSVAVRVEELERKNLAERLHAHDPSLWTVDKKGQEEITKRMGWLDAPKNSLALLPEITSVTEDLLQEGYTHALLLGMGGSSLAPEVFREICGLGRMGDREGMDLLILDSTDPVQVQQAEAWSDFDHTVYIVSSKSGSTSEVNALFQYFWDKAVRAAGDRAGLHFVAVTDPGTSLEKLAIERNFRKVFLADASVGGRNSALTAFGLVPAGFLGLDLECILQRSSQMARECAADVPAGRNPGVVLGAILGQAALEGRDKVTFLADPLWKPMGAWLEQLIAESSGKDGKGILPVDDEPIQNASWYSQDRVFVYLKSDGGLSTLASDLVSLGHPVLTFESTDCYDLPAEFYRWEIATAVACSVIGVNSFDQPDVQDNKDRTANKIKQFQESGHLDEPLPIWQKDEVKVFGKPFEGCDSAQTLDELTNRFLELARKGDYVAVNAYLPRNHEIRERLQRLRKSIQMKTGLPTTLGFGPRFLHSTGQLHKGGSNEGLFIQITTDPEVDLEIPGAGMTFGTLERAQALGDLEALLARERRAIRIHLPVRLLEKIL